MDTTGESDVDIRHDTRDGRDPRLPVRARDIQTITAMVPPVRRDADLPELCAETGYEPADWLIGFGIALCAAGLAGICTWQVFEVLP